MNNDEVENLKTWFASITDPKQQAIHTNIEIMRLEGYDLDRRFAKQEQENLLIDIETNIKSAVKEEAAKADPTDKRLSSEVKITDEVRKRIKEDVEHKKICDCIDAIKKDIELNELNISFYKRTFQILITFANEWVKS